MLSDMPPIFLFCLVCFINFSLAQSSTKISYITPNQIKDINDDVELSCTVEGSAEFPVLWLKVQKDPVPDSMPISSGIALILHAPKFFLKYDQSTSTYVLGIKNIQESDAGYYQCQIRLSPNNTVSAEVELQVRTPPSISDNSTKSIVITEAQDTQLECYAEGFPLPTISWRRENNAILPGGGSIYKGNVLKIENICKEDRGTYFCVAENGVGKAQIHRISLDVEFAPVVTVPRPRLGQIVQFEDLGCHVEAYPPPAITWEKDNITLFNNQHYSISHFALSEEFYDTTIRVTPLGKDLYGQYVCKASNKLGKAEGKIELSALAQKSTKISYITPNLIKNIDEDVELSCTVQNTGDHPVLWLKVGNDQNPDSLFLSSGSSLILRDPRLSLRYNQSTSTYVLGIKNIQESDAGHYQCQILLSPNNTLSAKVQLVLIARMPPSILDNSTESIEVSEAQAPVQKSTEISYITPNLIKDINEDVELSCTTQNTGDHPVIWLKVGNDQNTDNLFLSSGSSLILHDPRLSLRYNQSTSTYVLRIKNIQASYAGYYQCQIRLSPNNTVSAEVELQVRTPPSILENSTKSIEVSEAEDVQMECYAEGFPPPTIYWRRENNAILPTTGGLIYEGHVLEIKQIRKEDRGTYYCVAKNGVGRGQKREISLQVVFAPVVIVPRPRLGQALHFGMDLGCHVEAYPPPALTWEKDNITLFNNPHFTISNFATSDDFYGTNIRAISIEKEQYGRYVCKASNKLGTAEGKIELFETDHPICPPACATTTTTTTTPGCATKTTTTSTTTISAPTESNSSQINDAESS